MWLITKKKKKKDQKLSYISKHQKKSTITTEGEKGRKRNPKESTEQVKT